MSVMTVLGPVEADDLGVVLTHEHCFVDPGYLCTQPGEILKRVLADQPVTLHNLSYVRRNWFEVKENLIVDVFLIENAKNLLNVIQ